MITEKCSLPVGTKKQENREANKGKRWRQQQVGYVGIPSRLLEKLQVPTS